MGAIMSSCENYADIVIRDTGSVFVTRRIALTVRGASGFSIDPGADTIAYHAECKAHRTKIEVSELQAGCVEDSIAFCKKCLTGEQAKESDHIADSLRRALTNAQCDRPKDKKRWKVGKPFQGFINGLDLDI